MLSLVVAITRRDTDEHSHSVVSITPWFEQWCIFTPWFEQRIPRHIAAPYYYGLYAWPSFTSRVAHNPSTLVSVALSHRREGEINAMQSVVRSRIGLSLLMAASGCQWVQCITTVWCRNAIIPLLTKPGSVSVVCSHAGPLWLNYGVEALPC